MAPKVVRRPPRCVRDSTADLTVCHRADQPSGPRSLVLGRSRPLWVRDRPPRRVVTAGGVRPSPGRPRRPAVRPQPVAWRPMATPTMALRSNDLCWCGSGRKYKRCHKPLEGRVVPDEVSPMRSVPATSPGRRTPRPASRPAGTSRGSSRPRSSSACAGPARWPPRCCAWPASMVAPGRHHRRDRRLRARPHHRARRLPQPAQLQRLPEERLHVGQRGHLPRHPRRPGAAGRRHRQPRRHRLPRRRARRHQRHVLRRRRRRREPPPGAGHRGVHVAAASSAVHAGPAGQRHRPGHRGPRQAATTTAWCGRSSATASASSSTPTCRSTTTTSPRPARSCGRA